RHILQKAGGDIHKYTDFLKRFSFVKCACKDTTIFRNFQIFAAKKVIGAQKAPITLYLQSKNKFLNDNQSAYLPINMLFGLLSGF
ncbi:MAG: hypothetical protein ACI4TV_07425, partial [Paludibacteraceae bacterium]